jgi:alpha-D-ribose 1-methylphosphonate 5-triphosphate synthase subunit PhnH
MIPVTDAVDPGFAQPVENANAVFRTVLTAISHPGRILPVPVAPPAPPPLFASTAAVLLALADLDTAVWLQPGLDGPQVSTWLRFHCGCPLVEDPATATFAVVGGDAGLGRFAVGSAERPELGATVILQVPAFEAGDSLILAGPGIADRTTFHVTGLDTDFRRQWGANHALFPQGFDLVLTAPGHLASLPRTTAILEDQPCMSR